MLMLFPLLVMMSFTASWEFIQVGMFLLCFLLMGLIGHGFYLFSVGYILGIDYFSYALISLSGWIMSLMSCASKKMKNWLF